ALSSETAAITVKLVAAGAAPAPEAPFLSIGDLPPAGSKPQARFDRGRVMVVDRSDRPILDLGGNTTGAIAQIVTANASGPGGLALGRLTVPVLDHRRVLAAGHPGIHARTAERTASSCSCSRRIGDAPWPLSRPLTARSATSSLPGRRDPVAPRPGKCNTLD